MQLAYGIMNDKQAAKRLIKIAKKHPKLYNKRDVWYAKMIKKELKKHGKDWVYLIGAPSFHHDGKTVLQRTSSGWKDHLQRVKDASGKIGNTIKTGRSQH